MSRILLVLLLLAAAGCKDGGNSILDSYPFPEGKVFFTYPPIDFAGVQSFIGMGEPNVFPKDHGGFPLLHPYTLPANVLVMAMASGVIINVVPGTRTIPDWAPASVKGRSYTDYGLNLKVSTTITVNYAHVTTLHPAILAKLGNLPADERGHEVAVPLAAGDTIGWVGPHAAMDFSVTDRSLRLSFLNPSRYEDLLRWAGHVFDYFQEPVLSRMLAITTRQIPPRGGKVDYDVDGRIVGNWFLVGTTSYTQWSRQLAIV